jgi:SWI/SNF-related matrix-associated actin-dependent regulator of chromatin subfamily A3
LRATSPNIHSPHHHKKQQDVIVIDDDDNGTNAGAGPSSNRGGSAGPSTNTATEMAEEVAAAAAGDDSEGGEPELQLLGGFETQIVGIRYYQGEVGRNEMVSLVREPRNPYDANAIRVDNIRGEQVRARGRGEDV